MIFLSYFDSHSDAPIHYRGSIGEQVIFQVSCFKSFSTKQQTHPHLGWPEGVSTFSVNADFGGNYSFMFSFFSSVEFCYFQVFKLFFNIISPFPFFKAVHTNSFIVLKLKVFFIPFVLCRVAENLSQCLEPKAGN